MMGEVLCQVHEWLAFPFTSEVYWIRLPWKTEPVILKQEGGLAVSYQKGYSIARCLCGRKVSQEVHLSLETADLLAGREWMD